MNDIDKMLYWGSKVRRHWILFIGVFLSVVSLTVVNALLAQPYYRSTTKIVYQSSAKSTGSLASLAALAGVSMGSGGDDASAYLGDIVRSTDLMKTVLDHKWRVSEALPDTLTPITLEALWEIESDTTAPNWQARRRAGLLKRLSDGGYISFAQDKKSGVIALTTEFEDPRLAYDVNVFVYQELNNILVNKMSFKASANRKFIEGRLGEVREDLRRSENNLRIYRDRNRLRIDPGDVLEDGRLQRDVLINQEVMIQLQKQFEMAKIEEAKDLPVLDIIDSPQMPVEKSKPQRRKIALVGLVAGLFLGVLAALGYDLWLERRRKPSST